jgi:SAM-dependent methyltransferase
MPKKIRNEKVVSKLYFDKNKEIIRFCSDKSVLDLGFVDHDENYEARSDWLHKRIRKVAKGLVGVDIDKRAVKILKKKGYDVRFADVENFRLGKKFEVVVAGDLIEHLRNVGQFMNCVKRHLQKKGTIILTTPNCLSLSNWIELVFFGRVKYINQEHTHWYDENTLRKVLSDSGFSVKEVSFVVHNPRFIGESRLRTILKKIRHVFSVFFCLLRKQSAPTIFVRAELA